MNMTKALGLAAVGGLLVLAAPAERAQALSLTWHYWHRHRWHHRRHWRRW